MACVFSALLSKFIPPAMTFTSENVSFSEVVGEFDNDIIREQPADRSTTKCEIMTLECLSSSPDWKPTLSAPGIERIDPSELTLFTEGYELEETSRPKPFREEQPFILITAPSESKGEYCDRFKITELGTCSAYGPEAYSEFAVLSADTREVIHAYRLAEGYSLLDTKYSVLETSLGMNSWTEEMMPIPVRFWSDFSGQASDSGKKDPRKDSYHYRFNFFTGELSPS